jgi:hypothetical protein
MANLLIGVTRSVLKCVSEQDSFVSCPEGAGTSPVYCLSHTQFQWIAMNEKSECIDDIAEVDQHVCFSVSCVGG